MGTNSAAVSFSLPHGEWLILGGCKAPMLKQGYFPALQSSNPVREVFGEILGFLKSLPHSSLPSTSNKPRVAKLDGLSCLVRSKCRSGDGEWHQNNTQTRVGAVELLMARAGHAGENGSNAIYSSPLAFNVLIERSTACTAHLRLSGGLAQQQHVVDWQACLHQRLLRGCYVFRPQHSHWNPGR